MSILLPLIVGTPLVAAVLLCFVPRNYRFIMQVVAVAATFLSMLFAFRLFFHFDAVAADADGYRYVSEIPWLGSKALGIACRLGVDGINVGLVFMGAIVAFAAAFCSWEIKEREKEFYILLLMMSGGILAAFASLNMFYLYFFHELALVPTFIMIGVWGRGENRNYATFKITIYLTIGALIALIGLIALYIKSGAETFDIPTLTRHLQSHPLALGVQGALFPLLLFGFGILISLWPFHTWAPMGYGSAPTPAAMLHAGVLKKFGLYGLIRIAIPFMPQAAAHWSSVIGWLCLGNILYCGLVAMKQKDLNYLIGYSSVAHMGFIFLGIASLNLIGITGAVLVMIAHGLLAALTFGLSGYIYKRTGTSEMAEMGGLLRRLQFSGALLIMALFAGCGLPGFANFAGEITVFFGAWKNESLHVVTIIAVWGALVTGAVYMLRTIRTVLHGELPEKHEKVTESDLPFIKIPYLLLLVVLIVLGFFPAILSDKIRPDAERLLKNVNVNAASMKADSALPQSAAIVPAVAHASLSSAPSVLN
jgi:NADH-quinone oxidoreductase subunit M